MNRPSLKSNSPKKSGDKRSWEPLLVRVGGWALGIIMSLMLLGIFFGEHFQDLLDEIGLGWLYHAEAGVYADCSKESNRSNPYCLSKKKDDRGWRNLKDNKGSPPGFSLH
ncbi:MAG: hypothetical protein J0M12_08315 [Deltaproteobacteria bacterium]|nr:hypothetical protein [Deltaproteobacteria bacterium]